MNKYNKLFLVIKAHCQKEKKLLGMNSFEIIAKEADIPVEKLGEYLLYLQEMDLIRYSVKDSYIYLTGFGKKQEKLTRE